MRAAVGRPKLVMASRNVLCFEPCTVCYNSIMVNAKGFSFSCNLVPTS